LLLLLPLTLLLTPPLLPMLLPTLSLLPMLLLTLWLLTPPLLLTLLLLTSPLPMLMLLTPPPLLGLLLTPRATRVVQMTRSVPSPTLGSVRPLKAALSLESTVEYKMRAILMRDQ